MYIRVKAEPNAKKDEIDKISETEYAVRVRAKAERGEANKSILEILRKQFGKGKIKIVSGHFSKTKLISIED